MTIPLQRLVSGTSDVNGNLTLLFPDGPPVGQTWTGTIAVPASPSGAVWQAQVSGIPWATGIGPAAFGPVQALGNMTVKLIGSGLVPKTLYSAYWQGTADNASEAPIVWPDLPSIPPSLTGPQLLDRTDHIASLGSLTYPLITCGPWQSVSVTAENGGTGPVQLALTWYNDHTLDVVMGNEAIVIDPSLHANFTFPNQGPFLSIAASAYTPGADLTVIVNMTNRTQVPWIPDGGFGLIMDVQDVTIGPGASQTFAANFTYGGPAYATGIRAANAFQFLLDAQELSGIVHHLIDWDTTTGTPGQNQQQLVIVPAMRLKLTIKNESAGSSAFSFTLVADTFH